MSTLSYQQRAMKVATELATIDQDLASTFNDAQEPVSAYLNEQELATWAMAGVQIARHLPDTPQLGIEYFRISKEILHRSNRTALIRCADLALELAHRSPDLALSFLQSSPLYLSVSQPEDLKAWADMGLRMCSNSWKSVALAQTFFKSSHDLLTHTSTAAFRSLAVTITELSSHSIELATICVTQATEIFQSLSSEDHLPFLNLADAIVGSNWSNTWLYFERGPGLIERFQASQSGPFLSLIAEIVRQDCAEPFALFEEIASAIGQIEPVEHAELQRMGQRLVSESRPAAAAFLRSTAMIRARVPREAMQRWLEMGLESVAGDPHLNTDGEDTLAAYFRLESATADRALALVTGRVEFEHTGNLLRLFGQALAGEEVRVQPISYLVNRGLGWTTETNAATEGTTIYVPPYIDAFGDLESNLQVYKVCVAHQSSRITFGSFDFKYGEDGKYLKSSLVDVDEPNETNAITPMQRFFDRFQDRTLIHGLFSLVEDHRIDQCMSSEYPGLRKWLRRVKALEITQRPKLLDLGLRQALVENLLRASLNHHESLRWPATLQPVLTTALGLLNIATRPGATVQDTAEIAALLYRLAHDIPNVPARRVADKWIPIEAATDEALDFPVRISLPNIKIMLKSINLAEIIEINYENPASPGFYGDLKPELVQTMNELRDNPAMEELTREQIQEMLDKSVEVEQVDADALVEQIEIEIPGLLADEVMDEFDEENETTLAADAAEVISWSTYDEWDFRANDYLNGWCHLGERVVKEGEPEYYEETLKRYSGLVMEVRRQFELMRPESQRMLKNLDDGHEIDLDKAIQFFIDKKAGVGPRARFYSRRDKVERSVAVAFLLDMSGSTDESIEGAAAAARNNLMPGSPSLGSNDADKRIIDLEKESTVLIIEALEAIGDTYGIYGFSGHGRKDVSFHVIKELDEILGESVKRRIDSVEPLRSTRMGAAIRHANSKLIDCPAKVKILILVSDGRPQDHGYGHHRGDQEYAIHDTKQALIEGKQEGIVPFLITVDKEDHDYLKEICGDIGYEVVADIESLPRRLPAIYKYLATRA
jgi:nitric oxide reductase activation protein